MAEVSDHAIYEFVRALRDFGYNIDFDHCRKTVDELLAGQPPISGPAMFIEGWLREAKFLTEKED